MAKLLDGTTIYGSLSVQKTLSASNVTVNSTNSATNAFNTALITNVGAASGSIFESLQNLVTSVSASTDISLYNDQSNYIDLGINSSSYNGNLYGPTFNTVGPGDGYLYTTANNLGIGTASTGNVNFFIGGTLSASNTKATISNTGLTVTGSVSAQTLSAISPGNITIYGNNSLYAASNSNITNSTGTTNITSVNLLANTSYRIYGIAFATTQAQVQLNYSGNVVNSTVTLTYATSAALGATSVGVNRSGLFTGFGTGPLVNAKSNNPGTIYDIAGFLNTTSSGQLTLQLVNYGTVTNTISAGTFLQAQPLF